MSLKKGTKKRAGEKRLLLNWMDMLVEKRLGCRSIVPPVAVMQRGESTEASPVELKLSNESPECKTPAPSEDVRSTTISGSSQVESCNIGS